MKKHVASAVGAVVALVIMVVLSFSVIGPSNDAVAYSQAVNCSVSGSRDGNTIFVRGSGACEGLSFNFDVNDVSGGSGGINIGLPTEVVTEFITQTATVTVTAPPSSVPTLPNVLPTCSATTLKNSVKVTCTLLGKRILNVNLPISIPTIKLPPGQVKHTTTETVRVAGPTQTVTRYAFVRNVSPATQTVTLEAVSTSVVTETVQARQEPTLDGKVDRDNKDKPAPVDFGDGETTIVEAGIGILSLTGLIALLLLALYGGYVLGWKDKESKDTDFIGALLDQSKLRR